MLARPAAHLTSAALRIGGLPQVRLDPPDPATAREFDRFTADNVDRSAHATTVRPPGELAVYLRWLAAHRDVLFHGTKQADLGELHTKRLTSDVTDFGAQQAVFASDDPIWAMYFALLRRGDTFGSTRNGSLAAVGAEPCRRRYFLSVNHGHEPALDPGWLYVLPRKGFHSERPWYGVLDTAHWVSEVAVRPMVRMAVGLEDFPLADAVGRHSRDESLARTLWNARR